MGEKKMKIGENGLDEKKMKICEKWWKWLGRDKGGVGWKRNKNQCGRDVEKLEWMKKGSSCELQG